MTLRTMSAFPRFLSVGLINTLAGYLIILMGLRLGLGDYAANATGYAVGLTLSYNLHRRWTFVVRSPSTLHEILRFGLTFFTAYLVNVGVLSLARSFSYVDHPLAQAAAMAAYTITFFVLSQHLVFVNPEKKTQAESYRGSQTRVWVLLIASLIICLFIVCVNY